MWRFVCAFRKFIRCQTWIEHVLGVGNSEHTRWIGTLILLYVFLLLCSAHFHLHWLSTCKGLESHYSVSSPASAMGHSHKCVLKSLTDRHYWLLGTCRETLLETSFIGERSSARIWASCKNKLTKLVTGQMIIAWSFVEATAWRERATGQPALPQGDSRHWEPPGLKKKDADGKINMEFRRAVESDQRSFCSINLHDAMAHQVRLGSRASMDMKAVLS